MGKVTRKRYTAVFKARVALEAIKGEQTLAKVGVEQGIHLTLVGAWKKASIEGMAATFPSKAEASEAAVSTAEVTKLHAQIGQLAAEEDFDESLRSMSVARKHAWIGPEHPQLSVVQQCELISISQFGFYYMLAGESPFNLMLMRLIDEPFMETPFYGASQMARHLRRCGHCVGRKRVRRLMTRWCGCGASEASHQYAASRT